MTPTCVSRSIRAAVLLGLSAVSTAPAGCGGATRPDTSGAPDAATCAVTSATPLSGGGSCVGDTFAFQGSPEACGADDAGQLPQARCAALCPPNPMVFMPPLTDAVLCNIDGETLYCQYEAACAPGRRPAGLRRCRAARPVRPVPRIPRLDGVPGGGGGAGVRAPGVRARRARRARSALRRSTTGRARRDPARACGRAACEGRGSPRGAAGGEASPDPVAARDRRRERHRRLRERDLCRGCRARAGGDCRGFCSSGRASWHRPRRAAACGAVVGRSGVAGYATDTGRSRPRAPSKARRDAYGSWYSAAPCTPRGCRAARRADRACGNGHRRGARSHALGARLRPPARAKLPGLVPGFVRRRRGGRTRVAFDRLSCSRCG